MEIRHDLLLRICYDYIVVCLYSNVSEQILRILHSISWWSANNWIEMILNALYYFAKALSVSFIMSLLYLGKAFTALPPWPSLPANVKPRCQRKVRCLSTLRSFWGHSPAYMCDLLDLFKDAAAFQGTSLSWVFPFKASSLSQLWPLL